MTKIEIIVPAVPVANPRARATSINGKSRVYAKNTGPIATFKAMLAIAARQEHKGEPLTGPLRVDIDFVFPRTSDMIWKRKPMPRVWHSKKPDRDNLDKAVLDGLNKILWRDDAQICDGRLRKFIAAGDEQPHARIVVMEL